MDNRLEERLKKWYAHVEALEVIERKFLSLEASEDSFLATLKMKAEGKSQAEREMNALATEEWKMFKEGLANAEAQFHRERNILAIKSKAFDSEYLEVKTEGETNRLGSSRT